jgi:YesN/AraC family two-component response regulator
MARIVLIEDEEGLRTLLRRALAQCGHLVIEARSGREGLELFRHAPADLVITDIVMPEQDGLEVVMALRDTHPSVKIIVISGTGPHGGGDYLAVARAMGAAKVLQKPFTNAMLIASVNELLPEAVP